MKRWVVTALMLLGAVSVAPGILADGMATTEEIREKIAAIGVRSVQSSTGHLVVSGPDPLGNAMMLSLAEETADALASITGIPLPFSRQSVRILVLPPSSLPRANPVDVEHEGTGDFNIHRIIFADYGAAETEAAAEALCVAFLSVYRRAYSSGQDVLSLPAWLRRGVVRVLTAESRRVTVEASLRLWRQGLLLPPGRILAVGESQRGAGEDETVACGAFVLWFSSLPERAARFVALFRRLSEGKETDPDWMREWLPDGGDDPDEQRDRWLLSQRTVVRGVGTVSLNHLDALYAEWFVYPGRNGIPFDADLPEPADCTALAAYRDADWFAAVVRGKRHQIEMLAPGRPPRFQAVTAAHVAVLNAIERGEPAESVRTLAVTARRQWLALREMVEQAGGVWSEP